MPVVYIQPQTSTELGHKVRSYAYLLTSKLYTSEERANLKQRAQAKKKQALESKASKRNNTIADGSSTKELVALNDDEIGRCRELLHIDPQPGTTKKHEKKSAKVKDEKKSKKDKSAPSSSPVKTIKKKTISTPPPPAPAVNEKQTPKKVKATSSTVADEKRPTKTTSARNQPGVAQPSSASSAREIPTQSPPTTKASSKSKREGPYQPPVVDDASDSLDDEPRDDSVVDRAFHFVRNMFQLSDDLRDNNHTDDEDDAVIDIAQEQQQHHHHHHHARKLLSVSDVYVDDKLSLETSLDPLMISASIAKRQLLSVKANKHSSASKEKKSKSTKASAANSDAHKPKVGWAYRYRISRYLTAQKMKRTGGKSKVSLAGKTKRPSEQPAAKQPKSRKLTLSTSAKVSKRKLLEYHPVDATSWHGHAM